MEQVILVTKDKFDEAVKEVAGKILGDPDFNENPRRAMAFVMAGMVFSDGVWNRLTGESVEE